MVEHGEVPFPVLDASSWEPWGIEHRGVTQHLWLRHPDEGALYLWKPAVGRRLQRREHWAEKLASELAVLVGVPCAHVELAELDGTAGCLSRNLLDEAEEIHAGSLFLAEIDPTFDPSTKGHEAYTVTNVARVLTDVEAPRATVAPPLPSDTDGFDVFAGYLVFDALVLNRDRHAANWSVLRQRDGNGPDRLCPLYDNASALALSLSEKNMANRYASRGIPSYAARECLARPFARRNGRAPSVYEVADQALELCAPAVREHWRARVAALREADVARLVSAVPGMSEVVRTFTVELVMCTRRRLIDAERP